MIYTYFVSTEAPSTVSSDSLDVGGGWSWLLARDLVTGPGSLVSITLLTD